MAIFQDNRDYRYRLKWLCILFVGGILVLLIRLWSLAILNSQHYVGLAQRNHRRTVSRVAPRGVIVDREGRALVENAYGFDLVLFRDREPNLEKVTRFLSQGVELSPQDIQERLEKALHYDRYQPLVLKENISIEEIAYLSSHQTEHPELGILKQPRRYYPYRQLAAHLLGYVGEISQEELTQSEFSQSQSGDIVGKYGIEKTYNKWLTGTEGQDLLLVDSRGKLLREVRSLPPTPGKRLVLTLDLDLQQAAERALGQNTGAIVALNPNNGEILAMVSRPAFDPNHFAARLSLKQWRGLLDNPDHPLQNRAIQNSFGPGSIFKLVVALAGLEGGVIVPDRTAFCDGGVTLYGRRFHCWKATGHGRVGMRQAIQHSCNVYFYLLGQKLGIERMASFSRRLGLGQPTGVDLPGEGSGLIPSPAQERQSTGRTWYAGETISVAIGQGPLGVTPIQMARAVGVLATGKMPPPHVWAKFPGKQTPAPQSVGLRASNLEVIKDGMWRVVNEYGTGGGARVEGFNVCGKTGTVQVISKETRSKLTKEEADKFASNAWFAGFAPREHPEIVLAVLVQRGGSGGARAAPMAGKIFEGYYRKYIRAQPKTLVLSHPARWEGR